jgi:hypothetical protein
LYFDGCPSWRLAVERLEAAVEAEGMPDAVIQPVRLQSLTHAEAAGFAGSPTFLVEGRDLFPGAAPVTELSCRLYQTPAGPRGVPTVEAIAAALAGRLSV